MKIKTAILGYGRSGSTLHADAIEAVPEFNMAAVCDIDEKACQKAVERFGCKSYSDYNKMLKEEDLDLVVIVTRSEQHCNMTCDCLNAGKNVLVTKPWSINSEEASRMIETAEKSGKLLLPWLPARWGCDLLRLKEIIKEGTIGKVFQVRRNEYIFGIRHDWQTQKKYGGGYLLNWGPHIVDQPLQLIGQQAKSVYGKMKQIINPGDVEDVFYAVISTEEDVIVTAEFNIASNEMPNWVIQGDRGTIYVYGTSIEIHKADIPKKLDAAAYRNNVNIEKIKENVGESGAGVVGNRYGDAEVIYQHIANVIRTGEKYKVTLDSAKHLSKILDAIRESSNTGQAVSL